MAINSINMAISSKNDGGKFFLNFMAVLWIPWNSVLWIPWNSTALQYRMFSEAKVF